MLWIWWLHLEPKWSLPWNTLPKEVRTRFSKSARFRLRGRDASTSSLRKKCVYILEKLRKLWLCGWNKLPNSVPGRFWGGQRKRTSSDWISRRCHRPRSGRLDWLHVRGVARSKANGPNQRRLKKNRGINQNPTQTKNTTNLALPIPMKRSDFFHFTRIFKCS